MGEINISISGGSNKIGNVSQGDGNSLVSGFDLKESDSILEKINYLKYAIEADTTLSVTQRKAAMTDIANISEEFNKPPEEQSLESKKFFWDRLTEVVKFSTALAGLVSTIAKVAGLN